MVTKLHNNQERISKLFEKELRCERNHMIRKVTESEQIILNLLWNKGSLSTMEIVKGLEEETGWSKHAVISFLKKMEGKGIVKYEEKNRAKYYTAVLMKEEMVKKEASSFLNRFYNGKLGLMVSSMAKENQLSEEDIQELWNVLREWEEKERK